VEVVIRNATKSDVSLLAMLIRDSFRDVAERFDITPENCPTFASNFTDDRAGEELAKGSRYYILENEGTPCGCVALDLAHDDRWPSCPPGVKAGYLKRLAVLPQYRRRAFGKALVKHVLDVAGEMGCGRVQIGIVAENTELREWYERLGFSVEAEVGFDRLPFTVAFMFVDI